MIDAALALEDAGVFSIILECVPDRLAEKITKKVKIPTIGIGAGPWCDGQVLVTHDMIGLFERFTPKFVKRYINLSEDIKKAVGAYIDDVKKGKFPTQEHSFVMKEEEAGKLK